MSWSAPTAPLLPIDMSYPTCHVRPSVPLSNAHDAGVHDSSTAAPRPAPAAPDDSGRAPAGGQPHVDDALEQALEGAVPLLSPSTNPFMARGPWAFSLHTLDGASRGAELCRRFETSVLVESWGADVATLQSAYASDVDDAITWFLLTGTDSIGRTRVAGTLCIADCRIHPSETMRAAAAAASELGVPVPLELTVRAEDRGVWDVVQVAVAPAFRRSDAAAWLYHALLRSAVEAGVSRGIAAVTSLEYRRLESLGMPWTRIDGIPGATWLAERDLGFGYYSIDVAKTRSSMSSRIGALRSLADAGDDDRWLAIADIASIALDGLPVDRSRRGR